MNIQILNNDLSLFGIVTGFESVVFERAFNGKGSFSMKINANNANAKYIKIDKIVYIDEKRIGYIDKVTVDRKSDKSAEYVTAQGVELKDRLNRLIYPDSNLVNDSYGDEYLETVVKSLINKNAGYLAAQKRQIPNLVTAADMQRGGRIDYSARYKDLSSEIYSLLASQEMGLCCTIDFESAEIIFDVAQGRDLTAAEDEAGGIVMSLDTKTALELLDTDDRLSYKNLSVTAGLGEGAEREILEVGTELSGYERREVFTDARDIETNSELTTRGMQKLSQIAKTRGVAVKMNNAGAYQIGSDFDLGDYISADANGELYNAQVVKLRYTYEKMGYAQCEIVLNFDIDDTLAYDIAARHMDYDALAAAEAKSGQKLVHEVELEADSTEYDISGLDINADGGIYEIYVIGRGTAGSSYNIEYNGAANGTSYKTVYNYDYSGSPHSYSVSSAKAGVVGGLTSYNKHIITLPNGYPSCSSSGKYDNGTLLILTAFEQYYTVQQSNITSIKLVIDTGSFAAGTKIMVYKK
ncbi:MAG: siphovirus ReqiPepy6 Gp37-like family protein [Eubacteriales bacterium]